MKNGGYKIIDLKGKSLSTTEVVIPGIYDSIESTSKATLVSGLVIGETEYRDTYLDFTVSSGDYVASFNGYVITITDDDEITAEAEE